MITSGGFTISVGSSVYDPLADYYLEHRNLKKSILTKC